MQFTLRSLGGKLIASAAMILLVCMLLFMFLSWVLLQVYSEHVARVDAQNHITHIKRAYQSYSDTLTLELVKIAQDRRLLSVSTQGTHAWLQDLLITNPVHDRLYTSVTVVSQSHEILAAVGDMQTTSKHIAPALVSLVDATLQGESTLLLQSTLENNPLKKNNQWVFYSAVPIRNTGGTIVGVLLVSQPIDDYFAQQLAQRSGTNIALCISGQVVGQAVRNLVVDSSAQMLCNLDPSSNINRSQQYLALANTARVDHQIVTSPSLVVVDVEPLYSINSQNTGRFMLLIAGMSIFIFALGVFIYVVVVRIFYIIPMRRLQSRVRALVASNGGTPTALPTKNEFLMLAHSFSLLSELLESESQVMTEQMSNILIMSDALISTLDLEHLLGEIVARLGNIMQVKHVSLLLYGREMLSPWAVAQWSDQVTASSSQTPYTPRTPSISGILQPQGTVTVHADLDSDITMAVTTKMAAIPSLRSSGGKSQNLASSKVVQAPVYGLRRPRIPRPALRDLDMILAHMVIQRQKIAYGEDVATIYQERNESWARMALEIGYRSVIAVPLLWQDQAIGAFILYADRPYQVTSRDTFLLSTAAIQSSMAIQNAMFFAEVKDKNEALERANHLKSQFLANVTHELRTPLHSIISYGALILEGFLDGELTPEQEEHIQFMVRRAEDLSHLVDDMLDLSKIEADRIEMRSEPVELASCLMEVVNQLKPIANNKELYLTLEMDETLPMAQADSHRLRQIAINLVSNALKFTEKGGVTIRCVLTNNGGMLRTSVSDTGIGVSPAAFSYIFEAFRQADGSTTRRFGGTGLGLTIAKKLIELQGGEVSVESVVGQGSTFSFTLPVVPSPTN